MIQGDSLLSVGRVGPSVRPSSLFVCLRALYRSRYVRVCVCVDHRPTNEASTKVRGLPIRLDEQIELFHSTASTNRQVLF